ncbi:MAG: hypothetical protein HOV81_13800 [Kofleriaceae bacterium]|nr:hypothetical protein [Kofleriaceae bacterium]
MRVLPAAVALSVAIHGGAIVWVELRPDPKPVALKVVTPAAATEPGKPAAPEPTTITLLDEHTVVPQIRDLVPGSTGRRGGKRHETASRIATTTTPSGGSTTLAPSGAERKETGPSHNPLMTMRHPKIEKGPSADFWEKFEQNTKPLPPKDNPSEQLDSEIAESQDRLGNPKWIANASPDEVTAERERLANKRYEKSTAELQPDGAGRKSEHKTFAVNVEPDGTAHIKDKRNLRLTGLLSGEFDASDALMRQHGIDPYSSYKLKVLDGTREERYQIGKEYRTQQLAQSRQLMKKNLERLVASAPGPSELKQGLFELWDDCAESGSDEIVVGGRAARSQVIGFIRTRLPPDSPDAFTPAELARMNKHRRSQATFAPYGE